MFLPNNVSALRHHSFVTDSISELLASNKIKETCSPSSVTSPLVVVCQANSKKRLILDLSQFNHYVQKDHFKIDDWKIAMQYFQPDDLLFSFDLKSVFRGFFN